MEQEEAPQAQEEEEQITEAVEEQEESCDLDGQDIEDLIQQMEAEPEDPDPETEEDVDQEDTLDDVGDHFQQIVEDDIASDTLSKDEILEDLPFEFPLAFDYEPENETIEFLESETSSIQEAELNRAEAVAEEEHLEKLHQWFDQLVHHGTSDLEDHEDVYERDEVGASTLEEIQGVIGEGEIQIQDLAERLPEDIFSFEMEEEQIDALFLEEQDVSRWIEEETTHVADHLTLETQTEEHHPELSEEEIKSKLEEVAEEVKDQYVQDLDSWCADLLHETPEESREIEVQEQEWIETTPDEGELEVLTQEELAVNGSANEVEMDSFTLVEEAEEDTQSTVTTPEGGTKNNEMGTVVKDIEEEELRGNVTEKGVENASITENTQSEQGQNVNIGEGIQAAESHPIQELDSWLDEVTHLLSDGKALDFLEQDSFVNIDDLVPLRENTTDKELETLELKNQLPMSIPEDILPLDDLQVDSEFLTSTLFHTGSTGLDSEYNEEIAPFAPLSEIATEIQQREQYLDVIMGPHFLEEVHTQIEVQTLEQLETKADQVLKTQEEGLQLQRQVPTLPEPPPYDFQAELEAWEEEEALQAKYTGPPIYRFASHTQEGRSKNLKASSDTSQIQKTQEKQSNREPRSNSGRSLEEAKYIKLTASRDLATQSLFNKEKSIDSKYMVGLPKSGTQVERGNDQMGTCQTFERDFKYIKEYFGSLKSPLEGFKYWIRFEQDLKIGSMKQPYYYSLLIKPDKNIPDVVHEKRIYIQNRSSFFKNGWDARNFYQHSTRNEAVSSFQKIVMERIDKWLNISPWTAVKIRHSIYEQFYEKKPAFSEIRKKITTTKSKKKPSLFIAKFNLENSQPLWIKAFNEYMNKLKNKESFLQDLKIRYPDVYQYYTSEENTRNLSQILANKSRFLDSEEKKLAKQIVLDVNTRKEDTAKAKRFIEEINHAIVEGNLNVSDQKILENLSMIRKLESFKDIGFVYNGNNWVTVYNWEGMDDIKYFFNERIQGIWGLKIWIDVYMGIPIFSNNNKPLYYTVTLNDQSDILFPLRGKTFLLRNDPRVLKEYGVRNSYWSDKNGTVLNWEYRFCEVLDYEVLGLNKGDKSDRMNFTRIRNSIFNQFKLKYGENYGYKTKNAQSLAQTKILILKYDKNNLHYSWIRAFSTSKWDITTSTYKTVANCLSKFGYADSLKGEPIDYIITTSEIKYDNLIAKIRNKEIDDLGEMIHALEYNKNSSTKFHDLYFGTKDVQFPLMADTRDFQKFKDESNPQGESAIISSLFQHRELIREINKRFPSTIPSYGIYEFKGQSRGESSTTPVYEDISAKKNKAGDPLSSNVNILIKNSNEHVKIRLLEDYLKALHGVGDKNIYVKTVITHPGHFKDLSEIPREVKKAVDNYQEGRRLGWIDIGIVRGNKTYNNLGSIYGAVKWARTETTNHKVADTKSGIVHDSIRKLMEHRIVKKEKELVENMNDLFERHKFTGNSIRETSYEKFKDFIIDFFETFF
ncbi:MAG: hypothetical protein ACFFFG_15640 [Candidatus Thorarchaeota archaeon]